MNTPTPKPTLADLVGAPVDLPIGTITISVKPMGWYDSIDAIGSIKLALNAMPPLPASKSEAVMILAGEQIGQWLAWASVYRDDIVRFCHLASGQDEDAIAAINPVLLIELLFGLFEVNADFFVQSLPGLIARVGQRASDLGGRFKGALQQVNAAASITTSSASSQPGTASAS